MSKIIALNWKLNPESIREASVLLSHSDNRNVIVFPPFIFLPLAKNKLKKSGLGAQDVFWEEKGAFTGEVSSSMLLNSGAKYVLVGHSERRKYFNETDEIINKKIKSAIKSGLKVILCVGEPSDVRRMGLTEAKKFIAFQLKEDLDKISVKNLIVAYEPIWAIGTGKSDDPAESAEMAGFIGQILKYKHKISDPKVLYGGSVDSKNVRDFIGFKEIGGVLVGGASLNKEELGKILKQI